MKALCWNGVDDLKMEAVADPQLQEPGDVVVQVSLSSTCGSDLHYIHGILPTMKKGDVLGHEFVGRVVEVGSAVRNVKKGDRVVVPSIVCCGQCQYCRKGLWAGCERSNPNGALQRPVLGQPTAAFYGCSHMYGGLPGSHAELIRVPFGDVGCFKVPDALRDEQALFISDAAPTAFQGVEYAGVEPGATVAVWGSGAVGLLVQQFAFRQGAARVIAIDQVPERLAVSRDRLKAETIDFSKVDVLEALSEMTGGQGPDCCIDAVGMEAQGTGLTGAYDKVKQKLHLATDRAEALRQAILACRTGGTVSVVGIYFLTDKFPLGAIVSKNLTMRGVLQNGHAYVPRLLEMATTGELDASYLATHKYALAEGTKAYEVFKNKSDGCLRAVFAP